MLNMKTSRGSRGFNLFTPVVGTAIVVMAILIATGMVQNDIRLSRSMTLSYEVSSQSMTAKLIKATAEMQMLENIEKRLYSVLDKAGVSTDGACMEVDRDMLTLPNYAFMTEMTTGANGLYSGLLSSITTVTGYTTDRKDTELSAALNRIAQAGKSVVLVDFPDNYIRVTINSEVLGDKNLVGNAFDIPFKDHLGNTVVISVVPEKFAYVSELPTC